MKRQVATTALPAATVSEFEGVRYLHLGSEWVQGAMRIDRPDAVELEYVQRMLAWMLWRPLRDLARGHAVQLGLGAGTLSRFCHRTLRMRTTAVEINPAVVGVARTWFRLPADGPRFAVVVDDAAAWVARAQHRGSAQVLNVDLYDHRAASPVLDDETFYAGCRDVLDADGGVMSVNLFGRDASFADSAARIVAVFGRDQVWRLTPTREGNSIVIAARGVVVPGRDELERRAATIASRYGLPAPKWLRMVRPARL